MNITIQLCFSVFVLEVYTLRIYLKNEKLY